MVPRRCRTLDLSFHWRKYQRFQDQEVQHSHAELYQNMHTQTRAGSFPNRWHFPQSVSWRVSTGWWRTKAWPRWGPSTQETQHTRLARPFRSESNDTLFVSIISNARSMRRAVCLSCEYGGAWLQQLQASEVQGTELTGVTMVPRHNRHVSTGNGARWGIIQNCEQHPCSRVNQEQTDKREQF